MIIQPYVFDLLFSAAFLILGLDFAISGLFAIYKGNGSIERPKLLGLRIIKFYHGKVELQKRNRLVGSFYSLKMMGWYALVSGVIWVILGLLIVLNLLNVLP